jgi:hypothetical protein
MGTTIQLQKKQLAGDQEAIDKLKTAAAESENQKKIDADRLKDCNEYLQDAGDQLRKVKNKTTLQKIVLWVSVPFAIVEAAYIGLSQVIKRAP